MEKEIKIITLGESGVGKTSIINRICSNSFNVKEHCTLGVEFNYLTKTYTKKNIKMKLNFIDTAGQELFMNILPTQYIRDSNIVLLVFSNLTNLEILKNRWFHFYKENANTEKTKFILIGNKSDIFGIYKDEIKELGEKFAEEIDSFFITCSAKSEDNIDNLVNHILTEAKRLIDEEEKDNLFDINDPDKRNTFKMEEKDIKLTTKKSCC